MTSPTSRGRGYGRRKVTIKKMLIFERFSPKRRHCCAQLTVLSGERKRRQTGCSGHELILHQPPELAQLSPKAFWEKAEKTNVCPDASLVPGETPPCGVTGHTSPLRPLQLPVGSKYGPEEPENKAEYTQHKHKCGSARVRV